MSTDSTHPSQREEDTAAGDSPRSATSDRTGGDSPRSATSDRTGGDSPGSATGDRTAGDSPGSATSDRTGDAQDTVIMQTVLMAVTSVDSADKPNGGAVAAPTTDGEEVAPPEDSTQASPDMAACCSAITDIITEQERISLVKHVLVSTSVDADRPGGAAEEASTDGKEVAPALVPESSPASAAEPDTGQKTPTKGQESSARVSIQSAGAKASAPKRVSSSRQRMERELERLQQAEDNERLRQKARRQKEVQKAVGAVRKEREKKGVTLTPDVEACRTAIRTSVKEEERMALAKEQKKLRSETKALQQQIQKKYAVKGKKQREDVVALAESFYQGKVTDKDGIPEHVQRELTRQEIEDLKMVFDMFDVKGKGFITPNDVKRAASMLGFKAKKEVFSGMIEEVNGDKSGRVTFAHFLQFVVRGQGDGDDPLEAILQCFRLLDSDQKGYITAADLRHAADTQKLPLSNRAIREMIQEADVSGDSKVTWDEFVHLMLQSSMFRTAH